MVKYVIISLCLEKVDWTVMNKKTLTDLSTFIESVNKKDEKRNGKKITFSFTNRKRK